MERLEQRQLLSASAIGDEQQVNTFTTGNQQTNSTGQGGSIAMDSQGNYVVVWSSAAEDGSGSGIYAQLYNSSGVALGTAFQVNSTPANDQTNPSVAMNASGAFVVTWTSNLQDGSGTGVYAQIYGSDGVAQGSEFKVNSATSNNQSNSVVAINSTGNFVIAWQSTGQDGSSNGIYAQIYDSSGAVQGSEFKANATTTNDQTNPSVAISSTGTFVVAWQSAAQDGSGNGIYAQRFNASGVVQGGEFRVNTNTSNDQTTPHVGMDSTGNFVVTWQSNLQDGSGYGIYAQRYNAAGTVQGTEFRVNSTTTNEQSNATVAMDSTGNFVVTWQSLAQDGSGLGIYGQRYNSSGVVQGTEFRVSTTTAGDQNYASVAMGASGEFAVAWTSANQDGDGTGVFSQRFGEPVVLTGTTLTVTGSGFDNTITVTEGANLTVTIDGVAYNFAPASVTAVNISGLGGNDTITVNSIGSSKTLTASGGAGNDVLAVASTVTNALVLTGGDGNDTLTGGAGNDSLTGGAGNDNYVFDTDLALGSDTIIESGGGIDTLDFGATTTRAVAINLSTSASQTVNAGLSLTLSSDITMENVISGSLNDTLTGNSLDNSLTGGAGNDTYVFDTDPVSGLGEDVIIDSAGTDTLDFSGTTSRAIAIDLSTGSAQVVNAALTLTLTSGLAIENATGGSLGDTFTGNSLNNILSGGAGNDNFIYDTDLAHGSDTVNDSAGTDTLNFSQTTTRAVVIDVSSTSVQWVNAGLALTLSSGSIIDNVIGGTLSDTITGNSLNNILTGGFGNDTYLFDTDLAHGSDILNESGGGTDTLNFSGTTTRNVTVNLTSSATQVVNAGLTLNLSSGNTFENVIGGSLDDNLIGNSLNNTMTGGAGNDTYVFDTDSAQGSDIINESGGGTDTVSFSVTSTKVVTVDLSVATAQVINSDLTLTLSAGNTMENVIGGALGDVISGNSLSNSLMGGAGNDTYKFNTDLALGSDTITDATGSDTVDFSGTTTRSVNINLSSAGAQIVNDGLTLSGTAAIENVIGGAANDTIMGNLLNNTLAGGAGNDTYLLDTDTANGSDTINEAGGGIDTLDFSGTTTRNVVVDLSKTTMQTVNVGLNLTLTSGNSIENVIGGSLNDTLTGNVFDNTLTGGAGNDTYVFDADALSGLGSDTINESGGGVDTLDFGATTSRTVTLDLSNAGAQVVNSALTLTLSSATTMENVTGGGVNDVLTGNSLNNTLTGGLGNDKYVFDTDLALGSDTINEAGGGTDVLDFSGTTTRNVSVNLSNAAAQVVNAGLTLNLSSGATMENVVGGSVNDSITGNSLNNSLTGGAGNDTYLFDTDTANGTDTVNEAGGGVDTLDFSGTTTRTVSINLSNAGFQSVNSGLTLTLSSGSTMENVVGGDLHDTITGNSLDNVLTGGVGNDKYSFDTDSALGSDTVVDAGGNDTLDFAGTTTQAVAVNLSNAGPQVVNTGLTLTLSADDAIENVTGGTQSDTLTGNSLNNTLTGGSGNDTYVFDTDESLGSDTVNEAAGGTDSLDFSGTTTRNVAVDLSNAGAQVVNSGLTLTLLSGTTVENATGGTLNDTLTGNSLANALTGGVGDDVLTGAAGNDTYFFDTDLTLGSDSIVDSGGGADSLNFSQTSTVGVTIDLSNAGAQVVNGGLTLTLSSGSAMENVVGGSLGDSITGNSLGNTLTGGAGNDTYIFDTDTALGNDAINEAGGGIDTLNYSGTTTRIVTMNLGNGAAQVVNSGQTLTLTSGNTIENVVGGGFGNTLTGNSLNNALTGGAGSDTFVYDTDVAHGSDTVNGLAGTDTLNFAGTTTRDVVVDVSTTSAQVVNDGLTLTLTSAGNMENVVGGALSDTLTGNAVNNVLTGGGGNDALAGGTGNDTYQFDADAALGSDTIDDAGGIDTLDFSLTTTQNVTVDLSNDTAQVVNAGLTLTLTSASSMENVIGGALNDTLTGNSLNNAMSGGAGNDTYLFDTDVALGTDTISDTAGVDSVNFSGTTTRNVTIDLSKTTAQVVNAGLTLTLSVGSTLENVSGGALNDTLTGNSLTNVITGGDGNDLMAGGGGNDVYVFDGDLALGSDVINEAGGGVDTLDFSSTTTRSVLVNLSTATAQAVNAGLTLNLSSATTMENVIGGAMADALTGNSLANVLFGGAGDDTIGGGAGNNILIGGTGADSLTGGANEDLLIAGDYLQGTNAASLVLLRNEWASGATFNNRVAHLLGTLAGGANGTTVLTSATVKEDGVSDTLAGGTGHDWYFSNAAGVDVLERDSVTDADVDSVFTEISTWL